MPAVPRLVLSPPRRLGARVAMARVEIGAFLDDLGSPRLTDAACDCLDARLRAMAAVVHRASRHLIAG